MIVITTIAAGGQLEFHESADFFRLLDTDTKLDVIFYKLGAEAARAENVGEGYAEQFNQGGFDRVVIRSSVAQSLQFVMRKGAIVFYDKPPTGGVNIENTSGAFTQTQVTVTSTSGIAVASNAIRRYLLIQNNDSSADIFVTVDGTNATSSNGVKITAGGSYELQGFVPTGAVKAIASVASTSAIVVMEG